jgi:ribose transport system substrate-binding protein
MQTSNEKQVINKNVFVVVFKDYKNMSEFWKVLKAGIETAEKEYGINVEFTGLNSENDIEGQKQVLEALIIKKPSAIVMAATDYDAIVPVA